MSLFTSFNAGVAGITTAQSGLNTTAHNIANTKTAGYTRQQNIQKDVYYQQFKVTDKGMMQIGYGSSVALIRQIRDTFLDKEYRNEVSRLNFYQVQQTTELEIEDILGEMEGVEFNDALNAMWKKIEDLSMNPESITNRELFIADAEAFLEKAENAYMALRDYQVNLNTQILQQVQDINNIAKQIAHLNEKIATVESSGLENANDYRDERNLLLDKLATYTYFEAYEEYNGMVTVRINNAPLVEDKDVYRLGCEKMQLNEYAYDASGNPYLVTSSATQMLKVVWLDGGFGDAYSVEKKFSRDDCSDCGSLLGILTARGNKYGYYTDIPVKPQQSDYATDQDYKIALKKFEEDLKDYNNTTGNCLVEKIEAQLDLLINKTVRAINDAFAPNVELDGVSLTGVTLKDGSALPAGLGTGTKVLDATRCPVGADDDETIGEELFTRRGQNGRYTVYEVSGPVYITENGKQIEVTQKVPAKDPDGNIILGANGQPDYTYKLYVYNEEDPQDVNSLYTIQNLKVNQKILEDYSYLPVKGNPEGEKYGTYDQDIYFNMLSAWREKNTMLDPNALSLYGTNELYTAIVGGLGTQGSIWNSMVLNQEALTNGIEDKRQQVAGVSTDEEMVSLLMYQHAYNAASRYITVIDDMLEHVIERLG